MKHPTLQKKVMMIAMALLVSFALSAQAGKPSRTAKGAHQTGQQQRVMPSASDSHVSNPADSALWYNGDFNGVNGLANENNFAGTGGYAHTWDDFNVTCATGGFNLTSVFSNNLLADTVVGATWEIRQGVSVGNAGTLIASGSTATPVVTATGRSGFGFNEFTVEVTGLGVNLPAGTYFLNVSPTGSAGGLSYVSTTSGTNCVGSPCGNNNNSFFDSDFFGVFFGAASDQIGGAVDFSMGVKGTQSCSTPTPTPTPTPPPGSLWYNGDFNGVNGLANELDTSLGSGQYAHVYDDFNVPDSGGWDVNFIFSNNLDNTVNIGATWEIRQGVSAGNPGTLIDSGTTMTPSVTPTGRSGFGFIEFQIGVDVSTHLPMGSYFLNVTPQGDLSGRSFDSNTSGVNCVGTPCGNNQNAFFDSNFFGAFYASTADFGQATDFSMGVNGMVSGGGGGLNLLSAASVAGGFGIDLPTDGSAYECRNNVRQTVVFTFDNPVTNGGTASIGPCGTTGAVTVSGNTVSVKVNVAGCNQTDETVTLTGVNGSSNFSASYGVLFGDANGDGSVNNADIFQVRANLGQNTNGSNFRNDMNADGRINQKDVGIVKNNRGHSL